MIVSRVVLGLAAVSVVLAPRLSGQQAPTVDDLKQHAGEYVTQYASKVSGVSLDELFVLTTSGAVGQARIASDLVIVAQGKEIIGLRDPFSIDKRPVRDHQPRIVQALADPTSANWQLVQQYTRANLNLLQHNVVIWYSDPMLALQFIAPANQGKLTYKLEGTKKMNGVQVYGLGFKESTSGPAILSAVPGNARASGRFWIDPATGAIHMTELWVQSQTDNVRAQVSYEPDAKLALLLPRKATDLFDWRESGNSTTGLGGNQKVSFEGNIEYTNAQYKAIDLGRGR